MINWSKNPFANHQTEEHGGTFELLSGNEAIARGAVDAGVAFVSAFPGGPTSSLVYALAESDRGDGVGPHVQWSLNEKVAIESAAGAAMGGIRAMTVMKHFGANNAADMLFAAPLMFIPGLVIVVGDDPQGHTSHSEQDTRPYPRAADMPCLEASCPQEAYDLIRYAFDLSDDLRVPVYLRVVKWLSDWTGPVRLGEALTLRPPLWDAHHFQSRPILDQHLKLHETLDRVTAITGSWGLDRVEGLEADAPLGVVAAGNAYQLVREALSRLGLDGTVPVAKISTLNPLPAEMLVPFMGRCERVLVIEEIEPVVEDALAAMAMRAKTTAAISGRATGALPPVGELTPIMVTQALSQAARLSHAPAPAPDGVTELAQQLPGRLAAPRAGNPHRPTFYALRRFAERHPRFVFMGDVGEAASMGRPIMKAHSAMGAGIGMAVGAARSDPEALVVTVVGDGTLYGFALSGIADAVYNRARLLLLVVDNSTMESTGGQATPTSARGLRGDERPLDIEATLRALGVQNIERVNPRNVTEVDAALERCVGAEGVSVILAVASPETVDRPVQIQVDQDRAAPYRRQIEQFGCPALGFDGGRAVIVGRLCVQCGDCVQIAADAITAVEPTPTREVQE